MCHIPAQQGFDCLPSQNGFQPGEFRKGGRRHPGLRKLRWPRRGQSPILKAAENSRALRNSARLSSLEFIRESAVGKHTGELQSLNTPGLSEEKSHCVREQVADHICDQIAPPQVEGGQNNSSESCDEEMRPPPITQV